MRFLFFSFLLSMGAKVHAKQEPFERLWLLEGKQVYMAWKGKLKGNVRPFRILLALHGSGREAESYRPSSERGVPFYVHQRDLALACGYVFIAVSNGPDTWGTDAGMRTLLLLYADVQRQLNAENKWVLWGSSAGGVLMNRMIKEHPDKVKRALGTFPVYDLEQSFHHLSSAKKAWSADTLVGAVNPAHDPSSLRGLPYLIFHGREDAAVPAELHSVRLQKEVNLLGGDVRLHLVPGGHSTTNRHLYDDEIIREFLSD